MESKKKLKAQLTNQIAKKYSARIKELEEQRNHYREGYFAEINKRHVIQDELLALQAEYASCKDWIHRLQEFVDMPEDVRAQAILKLREEQTMNEAMQKMYNSVIRIFM